ncbi:hypothetical protein PRZ48_014562 [Zasmidium cellare]|uniref:NmrA-like domain-containing protein n=1 Tax=Zasmidium cellare TaxID=395010 RepID=A0ABR0DYU2_ZASCE|nr:hypothetical protein PRZ48_014562 [Zasmidium cellare]
MEINKVVVFGGTGAQAGPIVRALSKTGQFQVTVPTRSTHSTAAQALSELPNTTLLEATYTTEEGLRASFAGQDACYFIINSFDIREADEYFWTIRAYEIAAQSGLKLFVYSGAQNRLKDLGYDERYRNSHNMVKGHLCDWLRNQDSDVLPFTVLYGGVYLEMAASLLCPIKQGETYVFAAPVHESSIIPLTPLNNYGATGTWIFQNPTKAKGRFIDAGAIPSSWPQIVNAFKKTTGKEARFQTLTQDEWFAAAKSKGINPEAKLPHGVPQDDPATFTFRKTFGAWWNIWRDNTREYELKIRGGEHAEPGVQGRIESLEEWMEKTGYQGEYNEPTKMRRDMAAN